MKTKFCNLCGEIRLLDDFPDTMSKGKRRKRAYCKECNRKMALRYYHIRKEDPEYTRKRKNRDQARMRFNRHGLSQEDFEAYGEFINWRCDICSRSIMYKVYIDHDHKTGIVRGFLCFHCNVGIGHFYDSISLLKNAIDYLSE